MANDYLSYGDPILARRMRLADAMMQQPATPARTPLEGVGRLAQVLSGAWQTRKVEDEYRANQEKDLGAWSSFAKTISDPKADLNTAIDQLSSGSPRVRQQGTQMLVEQSLKTRGKREEAAAKQAEMNIKFTYDSLKENRAPVWDAEGNFAGYKPIQSGIDIAAAQKEAEEAAKRKVELKYKPQIEAATEQAKLPSQQALAA